MVLEINLWLNPGAKYNGTVNINKGEQLMKFSKLKSFAEFVQEGVKNGAAAADDFEGWCGDRDALYAWLPNCQFVSWNPKRQHAECFLQESSITVPINKSYDQGAARSKSAPTLSFRTAA